MMLKKHLLLSNAYPFKQVTLAIAALSMANLPNIALGNKVHGANSQTSHYRSDQHHKHLEQNSKPTNLAVAQNNLSPKIAGKFAFNYSFDDTGVDKIKHHRKYGDWKFNSFVLDLTGDHKPFNYKLEHVWYNGKNSNFYHLLETYLGHKFNNNVMMQVGNTTVPFGSLDQLSWWKNLNFYTGFDTNYQTGVKFIHHECPWGVEVQLGKNSVIASNNAYSKTPKLTRGTLDLDDNTTGTTISNELRENNEDSLQLAARVRHWHRFNDHSKIEFGLSAKAGQVYNTITTRRGTHLAGAAHINGHMGRWQLQLQFLPYSYSLKTEGYADYKTVQLGKDGYVYTIPSKANIYSAALAYKIPVNWGHLEHITVYDDYSTLRGKNTVKSTQMNILGFKLTSGPLFVTTDLVTAKNMYGVGQNFLNNQLNIFNIGDDNGMTAAGSKAKWKTKFNLNFGAKF